jgi:membrane protease YdiL (CAAX protease family)
MLRSIPTKPSQSYATLSPGLQFLLFCALFFCVFFAGNVIGILIAMLVYGQGIIEAIAQQNFKSPQVVNALWIAQVAGTSLPILISPIVFGWKIVKNPSAYLWTNIKFPLILMIVVFVVMFISSPLIEWLSLVNNKMVLPKFLDGLQQWMRKTEDQTAAAEEAMFNMPTVFSMIKNVLFVGLFTAIAEELMFRGVIQTIFLKWTRSTHAAVWITGILFSAFHMQFFGFLPRLLLGVIFGYFVVWSGSIWPAVWAHFLNNSSAIVVTYLYQHKKISVDPDNQQVFNSALYISSLVVVLFLMFLFKYLGPKQVKTADGEELG